MRNEYQKSTSRIQVTKKIKFFVLCSILNSHLSFFFLKKKQTKKPLFEGTDRGS